MDNYSDTEGAPAKADGLFTLNLGVYDNQSVDEGSSSALEIVTSENELTESSGKEHRGLKRKRRDDSLSEMPEVLNNMEEEIERQLDAKAAKSNLTVANVKNILRHVITNEHVLAMVRRSSKEEQEGSNDENDEEFPFEPKLTRAKTKELMKIQPSITWPITPTKQQPTSKCHVLIERELSEDSSDEEYRPNDEEQEQSDEEKENESIASDTCSRTSTPCPSTPKKSNDCGTQTSWTEDGLFKIPQENIGQRTRSKLSLSDTPLETIEKAFIPPDITTDMYDSECDDEDWKDFLNNFTEPLTTETADDDEADPEYNVLADEEEQKVDKEELRVDRAVKVSRKELNLLMAELFEFADMFSSDDEDTKTRQQQSDILSEEQKFHEVHLQEFSMEEQDQQPSSSEDPLNIESEVIQRRTDSFFPVTQEQRLLLDQQMRKHVQLTTQHFLQTYEHPQFSASAGEFKSILVSLKFLGEKKSKSAFNAANLIGAIDLIEVWEKKLSPSSPERNEIKSFMQKEVTMAAFYKKKRQVYRNSFPPQLMELISQSEVFLYPLILPPAPFRCDGLFRSIYVPPEDFLIALGLEQFEAFVKENSPSSSKSASSLTSSFSSVIGRKKYISEVLPLITTYLIQCKDPRNLYFHIRCARMTESNPIQYYFKHSQAPNTDHYVIPFTPNMVQPPSKQPKELLPELWREYLTPEKEKQQRNVLLLRS